MNSVKIEWAIPQPPEEGLKLPGVQKEWLHAIQKWAAGEEFIDAIYAFGSRVRGDYFLVSDLDLAILLSGKPYPDPERPYWRFNHERVEREIQALIEAPLDLNVLHLTDWDDTTKFVRDEGVTIYVNPNPYQ
ncbi:MAG: hypothetical protein JWO95_2892 [Verrucomicrobiales bacterium]|nr:hypothetical protein [Verrucomicrobiales bacterium]